MHPVTDSAALVERFRQVAQICGRDGPGDRDRAVAMTERLLIECRHSYAEDQHKTESLPSVESAMNYCRQHLHEDIDFKRLARQHAVSYSFLRQRIRQLTGVPPGQFLLQLRCSAAQSLLTDTDLSIKEIGLRVGIEDPFSFSRVFKRQTGIAPRHYRQQMSPWAEAANTVSIRGRHPAR
jgi:transcriptional regulator GlxA family with amidase domain